MHNRDKHPEIWAAKEKAEAALAPLMTKRKVHTDAMKGVQLKLAELKQEKMDLNELAMEDIEEIRVLQRQIANFAIAMGAVVAGGR